MEILSQQDQFEESCMYENNFLKYLYDMLGKIGIDEEGFSNSLIGNTVFCKSCSLCVELSPDWTLHAKKNDLSNLINPSIEDILIQLIEKASHTHKEREDCKQPRLQTNGQEKIIITTFETPNRISLPTEIWCQGRKFKFASQIYLDKENQLKSMFEYNSSLYSNEFRNVPLQTNTIVEENILVVVYKVISNHFDMGQQIQSWNTYSANSLKNMNRRLQMFVSPDKYNKRKCDQRDSDKLRDLTPKRKKEHSEIDKKRNIEPGRIECKRESDRKRSQTPKRIDDKN